MEITSLKKSKEGLLQSTNVSQQIKQKTPVKFNKLIKSKPVVIGTDQKLPPQQQNKLLRIQNQLQIGNIMPPQANQNYLIQKNAVQKRFEHFRYVEGVDINNPKMPTALKEQQQPKQNIQQKNGYSVINPLLRLQQQNKDQKVLASLPAYKGVRVGGMGQKKPMLQLQLQAKGVILQKQTQPPPLNFVPNVKK